MHGLTITGKPPHSFHYERVDLVQSPNVPDPAEIGYEMSKERFVVRRRNNRPRISRVEEFARRFFEDVVAKHFASRSAGGIPRCVSAWHPSRGRWPGSGGTGRRDR